MRRRRRFRSRRDGYVSSVWVDAETEGTPTVLPGGDCWDDRNEIEQEFGALPGFEQLDAAEVHPGADETWYDGIDADCDGGDDFDQDGDGHASSIHRDGKSAVGDDCFDAIGDPFENAAGLVPGDVNPSAKDACYDATDADCDGASDWDCDGDGFLVDVDCDDTDPTASPGGSEIWYDGVDQDCDGNDADKDHDGYAKDDYEGDVFAPGTEGGDCWDNPAEPWPPLNGLAALTPPMVHPGVAIDVFYDGIDADCDGSNEFDADLDGYATDEWAAASGAYGPDCDDELDTVHPGTDETCATAYDDDCDDDANDVGADECDDYFYDGDGDGHGVSGGAPQCTCGYALWSASDTVDCVDTDASIYTGAPEIVDNGIDENCDGNETCYADADGDSYRPDSGTVLSLADMDCTDPGEAETSTPPDDCDDEEFLVNPGASEVCDNGIDDNCNDTADTCPSTGEIGVETAAHTVIRGALADTELARNLATGDVDGDGTLDAIFSALPSDTAYLFLGPLTTSVDTDAASITVAGVADARFGASFVIGPDLGGDVGGDLAIGFPLADGEGHAFVFFDPEPDTLDAGAADITLEGGTDDLLGAALAAGDWNDDGAPDLAVGASADDTSATDTGAVLIFDGPLSDTIVFTQLQGAATDDWAGSALAAGDVNGDGVDDLVIGAPGSTAAGTLPAPST